MTQEEKQLLLKDLCARLPYGVKCNVRNIIVTLDGIFADGSYFDAYDMKPYLRPMSSMTEEEKKELSYESSGLIFDAAMNASQGYNVKTVAGNAYIIDYLIAHHIDYRGLIEKGLALEAPTDMYKTE